MLGLEALGDRTRLAIVRSLHAHGEMFTGEVAERLGVHPEHGLTPFGAAGGRPSWCGCGATAKLKLYMVDPGKIQAIASFLQKQFG